MSRWPAPCSCQAPTLRTLRYASRTIYLLANRSAKRSSRSAKHPRTQCLLQSTPNGVIQTCGVLLGKPESGLSDGERISDSLRPLLSPSCHSMSDATNFNLGPAREDIENFPSPPSTTRELSFLFILWVHHGLPIPSIASERTNLLLPVV